jgi:hypothetical protein
VDFTELFVDVDDFWQRFQPRYERRLLADGLRHRRRRGRLCVSEIMTILIALQTSNYRTFKHFYLHLLTHHRRDFPGLVSYRRFVKLIPPTAPPLPAYLMTRCRGPVTGVGFIDSTAIRVCHNKRIARHRSPIHFGAHLIAGLIAYARQPKKPAINFDVPLDPQSPMLA